MNKSGSHTRAHINGSCFSNNSPFISDCNDPVTTGYTYTFTATTYGETATAVCATGYDGTVDPGTVRCLATGVWDTVSGCSIKSKNSLFNLEI